jgi:hypothetical protein
MGEDLFLFNTDKRITAARSTAITIAPIAKPLIPPLFPPLEELPAEDPFTMPGGADPDDHWFPPVLEKAAKNVITHEGAVKRGVISDGSSTYLRLSMSFSLLGIHPVNLLFCRFLEHKGRKTILA